MQMQITDNRMHRPETFEGFIPQARRVWGSRDDIERNAS